jgi:hypothetical protein
MDRIDKINEIIQKGIKVEKKQSVIINNFFSIVTITMVCLSILYYTNYIVPAQEAKKARLLKQKQHQEYLAKRAYQIALSHKINGTK